MSKRTLFVCGVALGLALSALTLTAAEQAGVSGAAERREVEQRVTGGVVTLYALDPLARTLCFADGRDGHVFHENEVRNRCSDLDFGSYRAGHFSVGVEGARLGAVVNLGTADELRQRYGYPETVGNGQGFASLRAEGGRVLVLKGVRPHAEQELKESALLFGEGAGAASAPVKLGNIYLVRLTDRRDRDFERVVKLKVIAHTPNESVTVRWQAL
ncbi:MAG TPA: hypothetical protein VF064_19805 [Pyrinomonadaceae bacterium]